MLTNTNHHTQRTARSNSGPARPAKASVTAWLPVLLGEVLAAWAAADTARGRVAAAAAACCSACRAALRKGRGPARWRDTGTRAHLSGDGAFACVPGWCWSICLHVWMVLQEQRGLHSGAACVHRRAHSVGVAATTGGAATIQAQLKPQTEPRPRQSRKREQCRDNGIAGLQLRAEPSNLQCARVGPRPRVCASICSGGGER